MNNERKGAKNKNQNRRRSKCHTYLFASGIFFLPSGKTKQNHEEKGPRFIIFTMHLPINPIHPSYLDRSVPRRDEAATANRLGLFDSIAVSHGLALIPIVLPRGVIHKQQPIHTFRRH